MRLVHLVEPDSGRTLCEARAPAVSVLDPRLATCETCLGVLGWRHQREIEREIQRVQARERWRRRKP